MLKVRSARTLVYRTILHYWTPLCRRRLFPFPNSTEELRTVPARIMTGVQCFEALIGDQLLPTQDYIDLLNKHGFRNVGAIDLSPVHAVTYGQK